MADKTLLTTLTGENFQPVRLHYHVFDHQGLLRAFKKLRCLEYDASQQRWVWLYQHEAETLLFKQSFAQIPSHLRPVVLGSFFPRGKDQLLLDLRSCERAMVAIPFFDQHLPQRLAKLMEAEVVNKLFAFPQSKTLTPDAIFDHQDSTYSDPKAVAQRAIEMTTHVQDPQEKLRIALEAMESLAKLPLPAIERFPVHYDEEGIQGFANFLQIRQIVALEHFLGNTDYTLYDVLQLMKKSK